MKTLILRINFSEPIEPERVDDACHVFRTQLDRVLRRTGPGPGGAWGYGKIAVRSVTVNATEIQAVEILRELHRFLHPQLYRANERPEDATAVWSRATLIRISGTIATALDGDPELRTGLVGLDAPAQ